MSGFVKETPYITGLKIEIVKVAGIVRGEKYYMTDEENEEWGCYLYVLNECG